MPQSRSAVRTATRGATVDIRSMIGVAAAKAQVSVTELREVDCQQRVLAMFDVMQSSAVLLEYKELSLCCPFSSMRLTKPVRGSECEHIECFDLDSLLELSRRQGAAVHCPICSKPLVLNSLVQDGWVKSVLERMPQSARSVLVYPDGTFEEARSAKRCKRAREEIELAESQQRAEAFEHSTRIKTEPLLDSKEHLSVCAEQGPSTTLMTPPPVPPTVGDDVPSEPLSSQCACSAQYIVLEDGHYIREHNDSASPNACSISSSPADVLPFANRTSDVCGACGKPLAVQLSPGDHPLACSSCLANDPPVIHVCEAGSFRIEVLADGTLLLSGEKVPLIEPYLSRGGFIREQNLLYTSARLSQVEQDYVWALCLRVSQGEQPSQVKPPPPRFVSWQPRYPLFFV